MPRRTPILFASPLLVVALAACSGANGASTTSPSTTIGSTAATAIPASDGAADSGTSTAPAVVGKVSANTATEAEIAAALTAAGVPNAARWAREVTEYRPYPTDDPTLQRLQDNLAKYQPDPTTLQAILGALQP